MTSFLKFSNLCLSVVFINCRAESLPAFTVKNKTNKQKIGGKIRKRLRLLWVVEKYWVCSHLAVVPRTGSPGQRALPSKAPAAVLDSAAPRPWSSQRSHSDGRDEVWSYIFLDLTEDRCVAFYYKLKVHRLEKMILCGQSWKCVLSCTLQHAVIGLPVHLTQCCPEVCRLWTFLNYLHLYRAIFAETQLWWTPNIHTNTYHMQNFICWKNECRNYHWMLKFVEMPSRIWTYIWVRRSTALFATSLELLWALQPFQRYSTPCWLLSRTTEPLDRRPAQQQSTSNSKPSSGSSPRTQNNRHSATTET